MIGNYVRYRVKITDGMCPLTMGATTWCHRRFRSLVQGFDFDISKVIYRRTRLFNCKLDKYSKYSEVSKSEAYETKHVFVMKSLLNLSRARNKQRKNYFTIRTDL